MYLKTLGTYFGPPDADGDGVPDSLDVEVVSPPSSLGFSDAATPALGAGTYGVITPNGLDVEVQDVDPDNPSSAVRITASGTGGPLVVQPCGFAITLSLDAGDTVTLDCGSVTIVVEAGNGITGETGNSAFTLPNGVNATLDKAGESLVVNVASGGPVTVTVDLPGQRCLGDVPERDFRHGRRR